MIEGRERSRAGRALALLLTVAAVALLPASEAGAAVAGPAQRAFLDPSFGTRGKVKLTPKHGNFTGAGLAKQEDGRLVVGGSYSNSKGNGGFLAARFRHGGGLDRSFAGNGRAKVRFPVDPSAEARAVAVQSDGRIVLAGDAGGDFAVARLRPNGKLDRSFGDGGLLTTPFPGNGGSEASAVAVEADGGVVAAGSVSVPEGPSDAISFALARYLPDGTLDPAFGAGGLVSTGFGVPGVDLADANAVLAQPDGRIVATGTVGNPFAGGGGFALSRYLPDGSLDPSFDGSGKVVTELGNEGGATDAYLDDQGRVLATGTYANPSQGSGLASWYATIRYLADGSVDPSWGSGGLARTGFQGADGPFATAITPLRGGGSFVAGQLDPTPNSTIWGLAAYTSAGRLDTGFGRRGRARTMFAPRPPSDMPGGVVLEGGKPVVGGTSGNGIALARYR